MKVKESWCIYKTGYSNFVSMLGILFSKYTDMMSIELRGIRDRILVKILKYIYRLAHFVVMPILYLSNSKSTIYIYIKIGYSH